ncbi:MAG TPA: hypothetical protein VE783_07720 [Candidatus Limnocylindrales bacterium]|nr:hypothetical protein [Candidatus Limnocylindrales bacterium]
MFYPERTRGNPIPIKLVVGVVILAAIQVGGQSQSKATPISSQTSLSPNALYDLPGPFTPIATISELPQPVKAALAMAFRQNTLQIADPGKPFNATDVVDERLPMRRLIFAGQAGERFVVHYERGGRGHSYYALVFDVKDHNSAALIGAASYRQAARNIAKLKSLRHNDISNSRSF